MVLDTASLAYQFFGWGDAVPRYALTPDGGVLLVDTQASAPTRLFDTKTGTFRDIEGPPLWLESFVISSDSAHAYVLEPEGQKTAFDQGPDSLFDLDLVGAKSAQIETDFFPTNINISPDDTRLFLREDDANVCVFSLADRTCRAHISVGNP